MNIVANDIDYKLLNASMEYDDEDTCPLLTQHILDDGRKVLQICSDPVTSFKTGSIPFPFLCPGV